MSIRTRKAIGTAAWVMFMVAYCLVAMAIGGQFVVGRGVALELGFFILAGIGWVPVVMAIVRWMSRPDPSK